jgi:spermidine synthase
MVYALFLIPEFAAILYQLIWLRALFAIYGSTSEPVTVIVTAFMLGLGLGSLLGGKISEGPGLSLLRTFGLLEISIGIYGFFSLYFFHYIGSFSLGFSLLGTALLSFALLLFPTLLHGSDAADSCFSLRSLFRKCGSHS